VVASPIPLEVVEQDAIQTLTNAGNIVIAVGGGGIPVVQNKKGELRELSGVFAVIDKDRATALLAQEIGADLLLISTAVEKVALNFGKPDEKWLARMTLAEAKQYLAEGVHFAKGSMAPKIEAVVSFLENGGKQALITDPANIARALKGETGTFIEP
jgi:carbamate kinase